MSLFGTRELEELRNEHKVQEEHRIELENLKEQHRRQVEAMKEEKREEYKELKLAVTEREAALERRDYRIQNLEDQLSYERDNRQTLIDAAVQKELGQYETRYYHDLHTFIESHGKTFNDFQMGFMEKVLTAIQNMKPVEPKLTVLTTEGKITNNNTN